MPERPTFAADLDLAAAQSLMAGLGEPRYRAAQLLGWVYKRRASSFEAMTDFPKTLRDSLSLKLRLSSVEEVRRQEARDGAVKALLRLYDGKTIEAALMPSSKEGGYTACLSTQVGCAVCCPFCATGRQGFERNLSAAEMVDQALYHARFLGERGRISNIVFMGMGEPLANYENLLAAIVRLNALWGFGLGARSMTVSTAGLVPGIEKLRGEKIQVGLAISLHAASDELRNRLVPLNRKYPLAILIAACRRYVELSGRRISFEYCLFQGVNDSQVQARELAHLLKGMNAHVNLIAANPLEADAGYRPPPRYTVLAFESELKRLGVNATVRRSYGREIKAACGQLKSQTGEQSFPGRGEVSG